MTAVENLLQSLFVKTKQRKLAWQVGDEDGVWLKIGENIIQFEKWPDENYRLQIRNAEGVVVDQALFDNDDFVFDEPKELFFMARRSALNADEVVNDIMKHLEKI